MLFSVPAPSLPVKGLSERFPVHRIYCIGMNYAAHVREMGGDPAKLEPTFFCKPADAVVQDGTAIPFPMATDNLHFEAELVVALKSGGAGIAVEDALSHIFGYAIGIDLTRRDLQAQCKSAGLPWDVAKAFDNSAPCSAIVPADQAGTPDNARITLTQNGEPRQDSSTSDLIWGIAPAIARLSTLFTLQAGDLIYTGTPAGVGPVAPGDTLIAAVEGVGQITVTVG